MNPTERNQKIELYGRGFDLLTTALKEIPRQMWKFKPSAAEWSVHEVIIHLADSETNAALRARKLAVEPGGMLMGYDQDKWAVSLRYHDQNTEDALQVTKFARLTTYNLLKTLANEIFSHTAKHPEYDEPYTFEQWINTYSTHIPRHIQQINNNYEIWKKASH
jgi:hypothetical protein